MKNLTRLGIALLTITVLTACSSTEETTQSSSTKEEVSESTTETTVEAVGTVDTEAEGTVGATVGEEVEMGGVSYTITNVELTDERNPEADSDPSNVVKIDYMLVNNTSEEIPVGFDFTVYDANGTQMEEYPLDSTMGSLAAGKNLNGTEYWTLEETGNIEILVMPAGDFENDPVLYSIPIE